MQEQLDDKVERIRTLCSLGQIERHHGNMEAAAYYQEGLNLAKELNDKWGMCTALHGLGATALEQQELGAACSFFESGLSLAKEMGDLERVAHLFVGLGLVAMEKREWTKGRSLLQEGRILYQKIGHQYGISLTLRELGELARAEGNYEQADRLFSESLVLDRERGFSFGIAVTLFNLSQVKLFADDPGRAIICLRESLVLALKREDQGLIRTIVEGFANVASAQRQPELAAILWGAAEAARESAKDSLDIADHLEHDHFVSLAQTQTDETTFAAAWAEGREMALKQAVDYALEAVQPKC
jgi:tetratricopeptide (TPR) repeat protein